MLTSRGIARSFVYSVICGAITSHAAMYSLTDLGVAPGYSSSRAFDINESGQVAGYMADAEGRSQAFLYQPGVGIVAAGSLGGDWSQAYSLNDVGQVVGVAKDASGSSRAFISNGGTMIDLAPSASGNNVAWAINNQGTAVGEINGKPAMINAQGEVTTLNIGWPNYDSFRPTTGGAAYDINESGQITGTASLERWNPYGVAFIADSQGNGELAPGFSLGSTSLANGLNDFGQIVGSAFLHAFLYQDGMMTDLGALCKGFSGASDINNLGQIVGSSQDCGASDLNNRGFIYQDGQMMDLNGLISPEDAQRWFIYNAQAINEAGQITGVARTDGAFHAYILTPVPEPSTWAMMTLGLMGLAFVVRPSRRKEQ